MFSSLIFVQIFLGGSKVDRIALEASKYRMFAIPGKPGSKSFFNF